MTNITQDIASSAAPEQIVEADERRHKTRIPFQDAIEVVLPSDAQCPLGVVVEDVSFGGIALRMTDISRLAVGEELEIVILNRSMVVIVKYIVDLQEGGYRVGAEFVAPNLRDVRAVLEELFAQ